MTVSAPQATQIAVLLAIVQSKQLSSLRGRKANTPNRSRPSRDSPSTRSTWRAPAATNQAGAFALAFAMLLPTVLRHTFCRACSDVEAYVSVSLSAHLQKGNITCAVDPADRQHQRQSWTARLHGNALLPTDRVCIRFAVGHDSGRLPEILALPDPSTTSAGPLPDVAASLAWDPN